MDLTQLTEEQALLDDLESKLDTKESFTSSELMAANFEDLDGPSRRKLYEVMKKLKYEEMKVKVAMVMEIASKNKDLFEGPDWLWVYFYYY